MLNYCFKVHSNAHGFTIKESHTFLSHRHIMQSLECRLRETASVICGGKLTVETVLPPHHQGELEGVPAISRVHSNSIDVRAGLRVQLDEASRLLKDRQGSADVDVASEQLALVVGAVDVDNHVSVHFVVGVQHPAAIPLDQRCVQQCNLLNLSITKAGPPQMGACIGCIHVCSVYTREGTWTTAEVSTNGTVRPLTGGTAGSYIGGLVWACAGDILGTCQRTC